MRVYAVADIHGKNDRFERIRDNLNGIVGQNMITIINSTKLSVHFANLWNAALSLRGNSETLF